MQIPNKFKPTPIEEADRGVDKKVAAALSKQEATTSSLSEPAGNPSLGPMRTFETNELESAELPIQTRTYVQPEPISELTSLSQATQTIEGIVAKIKELEEQKKELKLALIRLTQTL